MSPGNILVFRDEKFGHHRYFQVMGVFLGGEDEESLIELRSLGEKPGHAYKTVQKTCFVPECLTRNLEVVESIDKLII